MARIVLGAAGLSKSYGAVRANRGVDLAAAPGEIHAIVGENGAGKSTLMRLLQGLEQPDEGSVIVDDERVRLAGPADALARGIGMVHQEFTLAPSLTLLENLVIGSEPSGRGGPLARVDWRAAEREGEALAARIGARIDWRRGTAGAPVHVQQFVEILRLLRRGSRVVILDEPTAVLAPPQVEALFDLLRRLRERGTTILFISHKLREVAALADRVTVLRRGMVVLSGAMAELSADRIAAAIMGVEGGPGTDIAGGGQAEGAHRGLRHTAGAVVLRVEGLTASVVERSHPLHDVSLEVHAGEIVGLAGVAGNGQGELMEALCGLRPARGRVTLAGRRLDGLPTAARRAAGMGYVGPDRRHEGLALEASVELNAVAGELRRPPIARGPWVSRRALRRVAAGRLDALGVRRGGPGDPAVSLSGGNQQRLVFAREIAGAPPLLLVSQPTRGVDLGGIAAIHALLRDTRARGGAVLLASEELDEIEALADRILVMAGGRIVGAAEDRGEIGRLMVMGDG